MAGEQTVVINTNGQTDVKVLVNAIGSSGSHVALVIDQSTTRLDGYSNVPAVNNIGTGIALLTFSNVTGLTPYMTLVCKVNGTADSVVFSQYAISVKVLPDPAAVADSVWDESVTSVVHNAPDTAGNHVWNMRQKTDKLTFDGSQDLEVVLNSAGSTSLVDLIWDENLPGRSNPPGSAGLYTYSSGVAGLKLDTMLSVVPGTSPFDYQFTDSALEKVPGLVWSYLTTDATTTNSFGVELKDISARVWDESISSHNNAGTFGKGFRQVKEGLVSQDGEVNDSSATTTSFVSNLSSTVNDFWNEKVLVFTSGSLAGQSRVISDYDGATKTLTFDEGFTSAPANSSEFIILSVHVHPVDEIVQSVWSEPTSSYTTTGTFGDSVNDILLDTGTSIPASIAALNDFNPTTDTVANVTTVGSVTNPVATDTASRTASKADVSALATSAEIAALNDFDPTTDTVANVTTVASVTNAVETDTASRNASKADVSSLSTFNPATQSVTVGTNNDKTGYSISGTKTTLDALNDIAATAIVSGGAITTSNGAVSNVTLVATTTTNTDMRGTDGANTTAPDNTSITAIKAKTDQLTFTVANQVDSNALTGGGGDDAATIYNYFTSGTNEDAFKATGFSTHSADDVRSALGLASGNLDTQFSSLSSGIPSEADIYTYFTAGTREDVFKADVSGIGDLSNVASDISSIKTKTDSLTFTGSNLNTHVQDVIASAATTIATSAYTHFTSESNEDVFKAAASDIYNYFVDGTREDVFKADVSSLAAISSNVSGIKTQTDKFDFTTVGQVDFVRSTVDTLPQAVLDSIYNKFTDQSNEDVFKADITTLESNVSAILADTAQLSFTNGLVDANASVAITQTDAAIIYNYFVDGTREDVFKADISSLATQSSVNTVDGIVDAIKLKTDNLTFNASNEVASEVKSGSTPTDIYNHFISGTREDAFKNSASEIRNALGMAANDLDAQLGAIVEDTGTSLPSTLSGIVTSIANVPTVAEFEDRTIPSANYFDPATDSVTVGTNSDKTGYSISGTKSTLDDLADFDPSSDTVDVGKLFGDAGSAQSLKDSAKQMTRCTVTSQSTPATAGGRSSFSSASVTTAAADHFVGRLILFTSGTLEGQASDIVDYELSNGVGLFSVTELTSDPAVNDTFIIV
jgi:hypothetical protein